MKTVFKEGMKVYDDVFFPNSKGEVFKIDKRVNCERVIVRFDNWDSEVSYTEQGRLVVAYEGVTPTLSTKPYILQGFEQKAPAPEFHEALSWLDNNENYQTVFEDERTYPSKEIYKAFEALRKLIILRDYYNDGWQPDWKDDTWKYVIFVKMGIYWEFIVDNKASYYRVLHFKSRKIAEKFLKEQRELLEIAKPLL